MADQKYPQSAEPNEYRHLDYPWLNEVATGLTAGAEKHPGETWRDIPAKEHAARALRHLSRCGSLAIGVIAISSTRVCGA